MTAWPKIDSSTLKAVIQSFQLAPEEETELETVKVNLRSFTPSSRRVFEDLALTTANAGIQYLLLQRSDLARFAACNERLDPRVILSFLEHLASMRPASLHPAEISAVNLLLSHKVAVSNVDLFKRTWDVAKLITSRPLTLSRAAKADFDNLFAALDSNSTLSGVGENAMSIETLLFIMAHLHRHEEKQGIDPTLDIVRAKALEVREAEIKAWIQENMPDYVDVPLSWVLKVYDLYQDDELKPWQE